MDPGILDSLGFDTSLAAQAAGSLPLYAGTFTLVKRWKIVPKRFEMLLTAGLTAGVNVLVALNSGTALFPALSACASGAWIAMIAHNALMKRERERKPEREPEREPENRAETTSKPGNENETRA